MRLCKRLQLVGWLSAGRAAPRAVHCRYVGQPAAHREVLQGGACKELRFSNAAGKHSNSGSVGVCYLLQQKPKQVNKRKARSDSSKSENRPCFLTIISVSLHPWFLLWPVIQESAISLVQQKRWVQKTSGCPSMTPSAWHTNAPCTSKTPSRALQYLNGPL